MMAAFLALRSFASLIPWQVWLAVLIVIAGWRVEQYGFERGRSHERAVAVIEAGKRIQEMEKNNAEFRALSARDRCLAFMRDSGLPDIACDQR